MCSGKNIRFQVEETRMHIPGSEVIFLKEYRNCEVPNGGMERKSWRVVKGGPWGSRQEPEGGGL